MPQFEGPRPSILILPLIWGVLLTPPLWSRKKQTYRRRSVMTSRHRDQNKQYFRHIFQGPRQDKVDIRWSLTNEQYREGMGIYGLPKLPRPMYTGRRYRLLRLATMSAKQPWQRVDAADMTAYYAPLLQPLYERLRRLAEKRSYTRRELLRCTVHFVQDLPLRRAPKKWKNRVINGVFSPIQIMRYGYADKLGKAILLASLLARETRFKLLLVYTKEKIPYIALRGLPLKNDDIYVTYRKERYLLLTPAAARRVPPGEQTNAVTVERILPLAVSPDRRQAIRSAFHTLKKRLVDYIFEFSVQRRSLRSLHRSQRPLLVNSSGFNASYTRIRKSTYRGDKPDVYVYSRSTGYYILYHHRIPPLSSSRWPRFRYKRETVRLSFDGGHAVHVTTQPYDTVILTRKENGNPRTQIRCTADRSGVIRLILAPGRYSLRRSSEQNTRSFSFYRGRLKPLKISLVPPQKRQSSQREQQNAYHLVLRAEIDDMRRLRDAPLFVNHTSIYRNFRRIRLIFFYLKKGAHFMVKGKHRQLNVKLNHPGFCLLDRITHPKGDDYRRYYFDFKRGRSLFLKASPKTKVHISRYDGKGAYRPFITARCDNRGMLRFLGPPGRYKFRTQRRPIGRIAYITAKGTRYKTLRLY